VTSVQEALWRLAPAIDRADRTKPTGSAEGPSALSAARRQAKDGPVPQLDLPTILIAGGLGLAIIFAVLAGVVSARVFFDASRDAGEKRL